MWSQYAGPSWITTLVDESTRRRSFRSLALDTQRLARYFVSKSFAPQNILLWPVATSIFATRDLGASERPTSIFATHDLGPRGREREGISRAFARKAFRHFHSALLAFGGSRLWGKASFVVQASPPGSFLPAGHQADFPAMTPPVTSSIIAEALMAPRRQQTIPEGPVPAIA